MEVVLGVGNLVFVAIVANRADARPRTLARPAGLMLALVFRLAIHERVDANAEEEGDRAGPRLGMAAALAQIVLIDIVFSIDSIITAVGMTNEFPIRAAAAIVAVLGDFRRRNPTVFMPALSFPLIGMSPIGRRLRFSY